MGSQRVRHDWSSSLRRDLVKKSYGTFILYNSTQQQSQMMMWAHVCGDSYSGNCSLISQYLGALVPGTLFHSIQNSADAQVPYIKWHSRGGPLWMNPWMQWANCKWGQTYSMEHEDSDVWPHIELLVVGIWQHHPHPGPGGQHTWLPPLFTARETCPLLTYMMYGCQGNPGVSVGNPLEFSESKLH